MQVQEELLPRLDTQEAPNPEELMPKLELGDTPMLTGPRLEERAFQYALTTGDDLEKVKAELDAGNEDSYKDRLVNLEMAKRAQASRDLVLDNIMAGPLPPDHPIMHDLTQTGEPPDKETVTEEAYTKKVMDLLLSADTNEDTIKVMTENPMGFDAKLKPYEDYAWKKLIVEKYRRQNEELLHQRGMFSTAADFAISALGIPSWLQFIAQPEGKSWTTAGAMRDQIERLYSMEPAEMDKAIKEILTNIQDFNPNDAQQFLDALTSYSQGSAEVDYIGDVLNIPGLALVKGAGKTAMKLGKFLPKGGKLLKTSEKVLEAAPKVLEKVPKVVDNLAGAEKKVVDATKAIVTRGTSVPSALSGTGAIDTAMDYAFKTHWVDRVFRDGAGASKRQFAELLDRLPDFWSLKVKANVGDSFFGKAVEPVLDRADHLYRTIGAAISVPGVERMPVAALQTLMEQAKKDVLDYLPKATDDAILNFRKVLPEDSPLNIAQLEVHVGTRDGNLFKSATDAVVQAKRYGMQVGDYSVARIGDKYVLKTHIDIDEGKNPSLILTPENKPPNSLFNIIRYGASSKTQNSTFQNANRQAVVQGTETLKTLLEDIYKPYGLLTKKEKSAFDDIMEHLNNKEAVPGRPETKGSFFKDTAEMEQTWMRVHGRLPSDREVEAYGAIRKAHDVDLIIRSMNEMGKKSSLGIRKFSIPTFKKVGEFKDIEARFIEFPKTSHDLPGNTRVLVQESDETLQEMRWVVKDIAEVVGNHQEYKALQFFNPRDPKIMELSGGTEAIPYALVRGAPVSHPIRLDKQVAIRAGTHQEYTSEWYVKQPRVRSGRYDGDVTALGFRTEAEANKYAKAMEEARVLFKEGKTAELMDYIRANLPVEFLERDRWAGLFKEHLDKDTPFAVVPKGGKIATAGRPMANGKYFHEHYEGVDTTLDQFHNLSARFGDPYTASRDPDVLSITRGSEPNPVISLTTATKLSPMLSESRAMGKLIDSRFYNDYQISAATSWIETFKHLLTVDGQPITPAQLQRNPLYYLDRAEISKNAGPMIKLQASYLRNNIKQLLGTPSRLTMAMEHYKQKLLSSVYEKGGEKALDYVPEALIPTLRHPEQFFRNVAAHTKLGLFNVVQMFVQGSAVSNVMAIHPVHGLQSTPASVLMRTLNLTDDPKIVEKAGEMAGHFPGWNKTKFVESHKLMASINFDKVGGENAYSNILQDPRLYQSKTGWLLDKGFMFFNAGERAVRLTSWNTAYLKWAAENPMKVGKATRTDLREIAQHAQTLSGNMMRDTNALWQTGWAGNMLQWQAYNVKLTELMLGRHLTIAQRGRLMLGQAMLYGSAPVAATVYAIQNQDPEAILDTFTGGDLEVYAANNGIDASSGLIGSINRGLVSMTYEMMTGEKLDFASRYGMSPIRIQETWKKNFQEYNEFAAILVSAMGPSGNILGDIIGSSSTVLKDLAGLFHEDPEIAKTMLPADVANGLREISTVNLITKLTAILRGQAYFSKAGNLSADYEGEANPWIAALNALSGATPLDESFAYHIVDFNKEKQLESKAIKDRAKLLSAEWRKALRTGDKELIDRSYKVLFTYITSSGLTDGEKKSILFPSDDSTIVEKIFQDFISEKTPESLLREKALNDRKGE